MLLTAVCYLVGLVGYGELWVLVDASGPPEAPQGEAGGCRRAGRMGRGQPRPVQLHPCRSDSCHGLAKECVYAFLYTCPSVLPCIAKSLWDCVDALFLCVY